MGMTVNEIGQGREGKSTPRGVLSWRSFRAVVPSVSWNKSQVLAAFKEATGLREDTAWKTVEGFVDSYCRVSSYDVVYQGGLEWLVTVKYGSLEVNFASTNHV